MDPEVKKAHLAFVKALEHRCVDLQWRGNRLAKEAGISQSLWSEIRSLKKSPSFGVMVRLLDAVGLEMEAKIVPVSKELPEYPEGEEPPPLDC